jgi:hypothetical protein
MFKEKGIKKSTNVSSLKSASKKGRGIIKRVNSEHKV